MEIKMLDIRKRECLPDIRFDEYFFVEENVWNESSGSPNDFCEPPVEINFARPDKGYRYFLVQCTDRKHYLYRMRVDK